MRRKLLITLAVILLLLLTVYALRRPLLRSCGTFLIKQDSLQKADALFVLSGSSFDRGSAAAKLFKQGYAPKIICTGGNRLKELKAINIDTMESDMTAAQILHQGIADSLVQIIHYGTSTREEADTIIGYCHQYGLSKIIVVSSALHTRRINSVLRKKLEEQHITLLLYGAPSSTFNELAWWQKEEGLIAVNNEWLKTIYYWIKY